VAHAPPSAIEARFPSAVDYELRGIAANLVPWCFQAERRISIRTPDHVHAAGYYSCASAGFPEDRPGEGMISLTQHVLQ
jgi:hypothetical protein